MSDCLLEEVLVPSAVMHFSSEEIHTIFLWPLVVVGQNWHQTVLVL